MSSYSKTSIINGLIACAGAVLAIGSYSLLVSLGDIEYHGISTANLRVGILFGGIVFAVAIGYEFYNKKKTEPKQKPAEQQNS